MKKKYSYILLTFLIPVVSNLLYAQITLTQSVDPVNVTDGGVACWSNGTGEYRENSFMRAYDLSDFGVGGDFEISSVEYGQGSADEGKVITVNIYTATTVNLTTATLTLVQSATHTSSSADDLTLISVPLSATIPAGSVIAFEVLAGDSGTNTGETFFPGINDAGENDESYLMSEGCSITSPTSTAVIGFPDNQYVMNIIGEDSLSTEQFQLNLISVYPNPTTGVFQLNVPNSISDFSTELYSITGQLLQQSENKKSIDISNLSQGVYLLQISTSNGSITKRIVKA